MNFAMLAAIRRKHKNLSIIFWSNAYWGWH